MNDLTQITLGRLLNSQDETIKRNAMSILKVMQKCDHRFESGDSFLPRCIYCFKIASNAEIQAMEDEPSVSL